MLIFWFPSDVFQEIIVLAIADQAHTHTHYWSHLNAWVVRLCDALQLRSSSLWSSLSSICFFMWFCLTTVFLWRTKGKKDVIIPPRILLQWLEDQEFSDRCQHTLWCLLLIWKVWLVLSHANTSRHVRKNSVSMNWSNPLLRWGHTSQPITMGLESGTLPWANEHVCAFFFSPTLSLSFLALSLSSLSFLISFSFFQKYYFMSTNPPPEAEVVSICRWVSLSCFFCFC